MFYRSFLFTDLVLVLLVLLVLVVVLVGLQQRRRQRRRRLRFAFLRQYTPARQLLSHTEPQLYCASLGERESYDGCFGCYHGAPDCSGTHDEERRVTARVAVLSHRHSNSYIRTGGTVGGDSDNCKL
jgi:hypothetical protein